jgi:phosphoribosyl-ATP pyrophosphohydrolase
VSAGEEGGSCRIGAKLGWRKSTFLDKPAFERHNGPPNFTAQPTDDMFTLDDLTRLIAQRAEASAETSYTRTLLDKGVAHCAKKLGEEAFETAIAAVAQDDTAFRGEVADLIYHLFVLLRARGVPLADVLAELERRTQRSGLEEKASRRA